MPAPHAITPVQLSRLIGTPHAPAVVDLRIPEDVEADPRTIPTARRRDYATFLSDPDPQRRIVTVCQSGAKIGQGTCALLRSRGLSAEYLEGGFEAWVDAQLPLTPVDRLPQRNPRGETLWVTRHRPKIDRSACPWLIRRFVDHNARFMFVSPQTVMDVAARFEATPFDVEGATLGHRGERCSFDAIISEFCLSTPALETMAAIVRAADTGRLTANAEASGVLAIALGLSRLHRDDNTMIEAALGVYDGLYHWARDARNESHDHA